MKTTHILTLNDVRKIAAAAEAEALRNGWAVSIAICDAGGHPLWLQRLDGASPLTASVAPAKAHTSAMTGKPSKAHEEMINKGRFAGLSMPVTPLEGGEPICASGLVIGAVGVSGVQAAQDAQIARAGIAALGEDYLHSSSMSS